MATIPIRAIEQVKTISGNTPFTLTFPEAASQTYKKGALVTFDGAGRVIECSADPLRILGVAAQDGQNLTSGETDRGTCTVWVADDDTIFCANVQNAGASTVTAQTMIGQNLGVVKVGNNWCVDTALGTHARRVLILDLDRRDNVGDTNGRLHWIVLGFFRILATTS